MLEESQNCWNCGAPFDHAENACLYCGTIFRDPVATVVDSGKLKKKSSRAWIVIIILLAIWVVTYDFITVWAKFITGVRY